MKLSLPLKLGIFVLVLFALVIATCLLWTPVKIRYYTAKLKSDDLKGCAASVDVMTNMEEKGRQILIENFPDGEKAALLLLKCWNSIDMEINDDEVNNRIVSRFFKEDFQLIEGRYSALHLAIFRRHEKLARLLIYRGASLNGHALFRWRWIDRSDASVVREEVKTLNIGTPLHAAAMTGSKNLIQLLLEKGLDVNLRTRRGRIPLHWAAASGSKDVAALLITKGASVNKKTMYGHTPLHYSAKYGGDKATTELLLKNNADVNVIGAGDATPLDWAVEVKHQEIASLLRSHGAKTGEELRRSTEYQVPSTEKKDRK
jgi:ankyrin repeat protein